MESDQGSDSQLLGSWTQSDNGHGDQWSRLAQANVPVRARLRVLRKLERHGATGCRGRARRTKIARGLGRGEFGIGVRPHWRRQKIREPVVVIAGGGWTSSKGGGYRAQPAVACSPLGHAGGGG